MEFNVGKALIAIGGLLVVVGLIVLGLGRFMKLGQLPGDVHVQRGNWSVSFPIVTSIVVSIVLTIVINLIARFWR